MQAHPAFHRHRTRAIVLAVALVTVLLAAAGCGTASAPRSGTPAAAASAPSSPSSPASSVSGRAAPPTHGKGVLARRKVVADKGGTVSADGVSLSIPARAIKKPQGEAEITSLGNGEYDLSLNVPWSGTLHATLPLAGRDDVVMHQVDGLWIPEGTGRGQATVAVTHLSLFSALSSLPGKIAKKACIVFETAAFLECLEEHAVEFISTTALKSVVDHMPVSPCAQHIIDESLHGSKLTVALGSLYGALTGACVGKAGDGDWTPPPTTSPPTSSGQGAQAPPGTGSSGGSGSGGSSGSGGGGGSASGGGGGSGGAAPAQPPAAGTGRVLRSPCLDLRDGTSGSNAVLQCIPQGTVVSIQCTVTGNAETGPYGTESTWDRTSYNGSTGYASDAWIYTGTNNAAVGRCPGTGRVLRSPCLDLRDGTSGSATVLQCIPENTVVALQCTVTGNAETGPYGTENTWDRTSYNGSTGYASDAWIYTGTNDAAANPC